MTGPIDWTETAERWVAGYVRAWRSNAAADIAALFTDDATYRTSPFEPPWAGRDAIIAGWLGRQDTDGDWTFSHEVIAVDPGAGPDGGTRAVVRGVTGYPRADPPATYHNLWVIDLGGDGRATAFTEWWMTAGA